MSNNMDVPELSLSFNIDPSQFDVTVGALLIGIGAEKYIEIFQNQNIGQSTLVELTEEDLIKLGVDDESIREKLLNEIKSLPIYTERIAEINKVPHLGPLELVKVLEESSSHLSRVYLSMVVNAGTLSITKKLSDRLLSKDKYASDIALSAVSEITTIINSMDAALQTHFKQYYEEDVRNSRKKKIIIASVGTAALGVLTILFIRSLKQL